jgi:hypothetical protein
MVLLFIAIALIFGAIGVTGPDTESNVVWVIFFGSVAGVGYFYWKNRGRGRSSSFASSSSSSSSPSSPYER